MATADDPRPTNLPDQYAAARGLLHAAQAGSPFQPLDRLGALGDALQRLVQVYLEGEEAAGEGLDTSVGAAALISSKVAGTLIAMTAADRHLVLRLLATREMVNARAGETSIDDGALQEAADILKAAPLQAVMQ